jgi:prevent-host-death family protein
MRSVTVHKAKTTLSQLIAAAEAGEEVVIHRGREPVARLVPIGTATPKRRFGALAGKIGLGAEFFDPLPDDELSGWER